MSLADDMGAGGDGDDILAAEYVLGTLPAAERRQVAGRIEAEPAFARLVDRWEGDFAPLAGGYVPVEAPGGVKGAIDRRLFPGGLPAAAVPGIASSLAFWRTLAVAALAALALYIALPFIGPPTEAPRERLIASLAADGSDVRYLAVFDDRTNDIGLSHVSGPVPQGRAFELWVIEGQQPPVSLGVIPEGANVHMPVSEAMRGKLASGALFAISVEPTGGSTTGAPTGPVVAAGDLRSL